MWAFVVAMRHLAARLAAGATAELKFDHRAAYEAAAAQGAAPLRTTNINCANFRCRASGAHERIRENVNS
jgi:hypothetical protein